MVAVQVPVSVGQSWVSAGRRAVAMLAAGALVATAAVVIGASYVEKAALRHYGTSGAPATASNAALPSGLQAAIDATLASEPLASPVGITLSWGKDGKVSFAARHGSTTFSLRPAALVGNAYEPLAPGQFVFGGASTTETLGHGVTAWYKVFSKGFEQGFTGTGCGAGSPRL
jgi:hypothetical protein